MKKILLIFACGLYALSAHAQQQGQVVETTDAAVNQYGVTVDKFPLWASSQNNILVLENKEKNYKFWMDNRIQMDGAYYFNDKELIGNSSNPKFGKLASGVMLRRVRMAVKAQVAKNWYGEVDLSFADGKFELEDAVIRYTGICNSEIWAGNFKEDFSMEETTTSRYTTFMERAMVVSAFAPGRHVGLRYQWGLNWIRASAGVSWQLIDSQETRTAVEDQSKLGNSMGANYTGKVVWMPWGGQREYGLHVGYNISYRSPRKVDDEGAGMGTNEFGSRNCTSVSRLKMLNTANYNELTGGKGVIQNVRYDLLQGIELAGYWKGLRVNGEYIWNQTHTTKEALDPRMLVFSGWYAQASYLLFGGKQRYDTGQSEFTQPTRGRSWGDVELMFRYDYLDLNDKYVYGGSGQNYIFGAVYHINNNVKFMVNYQLSHNDHYANGKGKNNVGLDAAGVPTTNPFSVVSHQGVKFSTLQARIEIDF